MIGDFAVLFMKNGASFFIAELNNLDEAVEKAKEVAESREVECLVYGYKERVWKYCAHPHRAVGAVTSAASA